MFFFVCISAAAKEDPENESAKDVKIEPETTNLTNEKLTIEANTEKEQVSANYNSPKPEEPNSISKPPKAASQNERMEETEKTPEKSDFEKSEISNPDKKSETTNSEKELPEENPETQFKTKSFTIFRVFRTPSILLSSVPFMAVYMTVGLMRVFLAPLLSDLLDLEESDFDFYFAASPAAGIVSSPIIAKLSDGKFKWVIYIGCPIFGCIGSALLIYLTTFTTSKLAIQICLIIALCFFGLGLTTCSTARFVILDDLFHYHDPDDKEKDYRVVLASWNSNICYLGGRWLGNALIGGVIFDLIGYTGVAFVMASLYLLSLMSAVTSCVKFSTKLSKQT